MSSDIYAYAAYMVFVIVLLAYTLFLRKKHRQLEKQDQK